MSFSFASWLSKEQSADQSQPIECYIWRQNGLGSYWQTSSSAEFTDINGRVYTPYPIQRSNIIVSSDLSKGELTIATTRDNPVAKLFIGAPPDFTVSVNIYRVQRQEGSDGGQLIWKGRVASCEVADNEATLTCQDYLGSLDRKANRIVSSQLCRHVQYSDNCGVNKSSYAVLAIATESGASLVSGTFSNYDDSYFTNGYVVRSDGTQRFIIAHSGNTISLQYKFLDFGSSEIVTAYPGCDMRITTCIEKFNNIENHGGYPNIPGTKPFGSEKFM